MRRKETEKITKKGMKTTDVFHAQENEGRSREKRDSGKRQRAVGRVTGRRKKGILNSKLSDSGGKLIFEDNELCCQFLNNYVKLPRLGSLKAENIEDVSAEFVPLFSTERYADRVKEIIIPTEKGEITYYLLSLIEHKTRVDYNIHMQIFRYMVYIWERHEKESELRNPGCTKRKDFKYPPIIPIVYYEGKDKWTAPEGFKDRILLGDEFVKYLPNFSYYMVPIHTYSNEDLIEHGDGISFVMLFNRMQTMEDVERFREIPPERLEALVKGLPEYQVEIAAMVFRAFLRKENVPEEETEELVGRVKEKRMAELFGNMEKMDIQAERRNTSGFHGSDQVQVWRIHIAVGNGLRPGKPDKCRRRGGLAGAAFPA